MCTGTMRFVHVECLNSWRRTSANPKSSYECDQCRYKYSFHRTMYATILRTSLILHVFTILVFFCVVLACGFLVKGLDFFFNGNTGSLQDVVVNAEKFNEYANQ